MTVAANENVSAQLQANGNGLGQQSPPNASILQGVERPNTHGQMIDEVSRKLGIMKVSDNQEKTHYLGASHWVTIGLSEIADFRTYLRQNLRELEGEAFENLALTAADSVNTISLFKGTMPPVSKEEVLSWIPPRVIADELVTRYMESHNPTTVLLHQSTFRQEYAGFWLDPSKATYAWLALLFSVFRLAEVRRELDDFTSELGGDHSHLIAVYRRLTIQCLTASDYTSPSYLTLKTMLFYIECEVYASQDSAMEISCVLSVAIRLAMQMGIHREWKSHPQLNPFQNEMRRRLWACLHCLDIMYSLQVSLPSTVRQEDCDCEPPHNIRDEDFSNDSKTLPPSRPLTESTEASYLIAKRGLILVLDRVLKATERKGDIPRDEIRKLEDAMLSSRNAIPPYLQVAFGKNAGPIPDYLKRQRMHLDRLVKLSQCMLYRRFLRRAHHDEKLMHYRRSCIDASLSLLYQQADIYKSWGATVENPAGIQKRHIFSLTSHDFFSAGMCLAIDLYYGLIEEPRAPKSSDVRLWGFDRRPEMIAALERSVGYWGIAKGKSVEAAKAWGLFSFTVNKARQTLGSTPSSSWTSDLEQSSSDNAPSIDPVDGSKDGMVDMPSSETLDFDWVRFCKPDLP